MDEILGYFSDPLFIIPLRCNCYSIYSDNLDIFL